MLWWKCGHCGRWVSTDVTRHLHAWNDEVLKAFKEFQRVERIDPKVARENLLRKYEESTRTYFRTGSEPTIESDTRPEGE